ncbi:Uncharacterised protein [Mycobacteroides abscessus subsp. abscessus]|nr:Uncharacterised protein [Mycobacteroides abscessus subsp. abscessus]
MLTAVVADDDSESAFAQWIDSLTSLTRSDVAARQWRERRYAFAYGLGEALAGPTASTPAVTGAAIYGIWLTWGLLYVGQTTEASRRLRDLPVGESHHLPNTFPPEIWDRVVVVNWPALPEAEAAMEEFDPKIVGLALEHHLQLRTEPLANTARRTKAGGWQSINRVNSKSRGARAAAAVAALSARVDRLWDAAAVHETGSGSLPSSIRCVRPAQLLARMS